MAHINGEIVINRPVQEVFDFVADERNEPRYNPGMVGPSCSRPSRSASAAASAPKCARGRDRS